MSTGVFDVCGCVCQVDMHRFGRNSTGGRRAVGDATPQLLPLSGNIRMRMCHAHNCILYLIATVWHPPLSVTRPSGHATGQPVLVANFEVSRWPVMGCVFIETCAIYFIYNIKTSCAHAAAWICLEASAAGQGRCRPVTGLPLRVPTRLRRCNAQAQL
jgi:hypothetical protein